MTFNYNLPYFIDYAHPVVENIVIFCVAVLTAIVVSAEAQAFAATLLGDSRDGAKDRFHFNVFLHMSILGTLNFLIAGFGWAKEIDIDTRKFKNHPRLFLILSRLSGPVANILMANIAASLSWILGRWGFQDVVFSTIAAVNVSMAIYGMLFVPPLPGSAFLFALFPNIDFSQTMKKNFCRFGGFAIVVTFLVIRISGWDGISSVINPVVATLSGLILNV